MKTLTNTSTHVCRIYDSRDQRAKDREVLERLGFTYFNEYRDVNGPAMQAAHYRPHYDLRPYDPRNGTRGIRTTPEAIIRRGGTR